MNCTPENPCADCDTGKLIRRMTEKLAELGRDREILLSAARESENALLDYVDRLEKQGGMMGYGRKVLRQLAAAIAQVERQ